MLTSDSACKNLVVNMETNQLSREYEVWLDETIVDQGNKEEDVEFRLLQVVYGQLHELHLSNQGAKR